jgi:hypothetical protein
VLLVGRREAHLGVGRLGVVAVLEDRPAHPRHALLERGVPRALRRGLEPLLAEEAHRLETERALRVLLDRLAQVLPRAVAVARREPGAAAADEPALLLLGRRRDLLGGEVVEEASPRRRGLRGVLRLLERLSDALARAERLLGREADDEGAAVAVERAADVADLRRAAEVVLRLAAVEVLVRQREVEEADLRAGLGRRRGVDPPAQGLGALLLAAERGVGVGRGVDHATRPLVLPVRLEEVRRRVERRLGLLREEERPGLEDPRLLGLGGGGVGVPEDAEGLGRVRPVPLAHRLLGGPEVLLEVGPLVGGGREAGEQDGGGEEAAKGTSEHGVLPGRGPRDRGGTAPAGHPTPQAGRQEPLDTAGRVWFPPGPCRGRSPPPVPS